VTYHAKAPSAGSTEGNGNSRGPLRRAFATRVASREDKGSGAPAGRRLSLLLLGAFALLALIAPAANAAAPAVTIEPGSQVGVTSAEAKGTVDPNGKETTYRFEYLSDEAFNAEVNEKQSVYVYTVGAPFGLSFEGETTPPIPADASAATVQSALNALSSIGGVGGSVSVTGGPADESGSAPFVITFGGSLGQTDVEPISVETVYGYTETNQTGHAPGFGAAAPAGGATLGAGDPTTPVQATLENLAPDTTYHLRLVATNADGSTAAVAPTFTTAAPTAPTLTIDPASDVRYTTAHLAGAVDPEGGSVNPIDGPLPIDWEFQLTTDPASGWSPTGVSGRISGGEAASPDPIPVSGDAGFLADETLYKYRLVATYAGGGTAISAEGSFETEGPITPPVVTIDPVTAITAVSAHFSGQVTAGNPDPGFNAFCSFLYVTDGGFHPSNEQQRLIVAASGGTYTLGFNGGGSLETTAPIAFDASAATVKAALEALPNVASGDVTVSGGPGNAGGTSPYTIDFAGALAARNLDPLTADGSGLSGTNAGATVNTTKEGHTGFEDAAETPCSVNPVTGTAPTAVSANATGLKPGNTYHVGLRASNGGGITIAAATFATPVVAPVVRTGSAHVSPTTALSAGSLNPSGAETTYHFEYGPGFAQKTAEKVLVAGNDTVSVSENLTGLEPSTTYQYRLVATNSVATVTGAQKSFTTDKASADPCPNAAFRTGFAANLPDCRAYELVNPPDRQWGDVLRMLSAGDDGEYTGFTTMVAGDEAKGAQVGSYMLAHRTPTGWVSTDSNPVLLRGHDGLEDSYLMAYSADRTQAIVSSNVTLDEKDISPQDLYTLDVGTGVVHLQTYGPLSNPNGFVRMLGASTDLSRTVFMTQSELLPDAVLKPNTFEGPIYIREGDELGLISILPDGTSFPAVPAGNWADHGLGVTSLLGAKAAHGGTHVVSDDARRVFFNGGDSSRQGPLYLRDMTVSPARTVAVSASERTGEEGTEYPGKFIGASHDGSVAYFESPEQLTDEATLGGGIYRFELDAPAGQRLEQLTPANQNPPNPMGTPGDLGGLSLGTAIMSDDASHVYFTSEAVLTPDAVAGVVNGYVWDGGTTKLVASFGKPGVGEPGEAGFVGRVSRDGRYALFTSTHSVDGAPNNGYRAVYEYDDNTGDIACASCRPDGSPSQGDASLADYPQSVIGSEVTQPRNLADDGTVFFNSSDRIVAADQTNFGDVYQYRAGKVALLTSGQGNRSSFLTDNSDDGKTVFVISPTAFLPQDKDANELDAYAVRVNGGFPQPPPEPAPCEGEACRGAVSTPPAVVAPGTPNFFGAGNAKSGRNQGKKHHKKCGKKQKQKQKKCQKKKHHKKKSHKRDASRNGRTGR
jgi:hypothetical protein